MSTIEKKEEKAVDSCSTNKSCSTENAKEQPQKQAEQQKVTQVDHTTKKNGGSCCG